MKTVEVDIARKLYRARNGGPDLLALRDLKLTVAQREFTCIVGPSGCGKTTLLNIVSGLDEDVEGAVRVAGHAPGEGQPVGYMFQSPRLMPWLSVRDNVALVLGEGADSAAADELLRQVGLGDFMDAWPGELSGGMRRRVALVRAFVTGPELLLLDEPFLSLDAPVANRLRLLLLDIWQSRPTTIIFVTHDLREALFLADRVLFMSPSPGRIVLDLPIDLERPREAEGEAVEMKRLELLKTYPDILAGLTASAEEGGDDHAD
ncbi:MAG: ABC transporter ATP-binding protein [Alphaproteobacteria bacterium]